MFQFLDPQYLYLLLALPVVIAVYVWGCIKSRRRFSRNCDDRLFHSLTPTRSPFNRHLKFGLLIIAAALLTIMLARPQYGISKQHDTTSGIEAVVMVDVSNSMLARDVLPSRLDRAKLLVTNLIERMQNDKIALGVFAGEAYPQMPMTSDYASAKLFIDALSTGMVTMQGTDLGAAINLGIKSFTDQRNVGKAIILITDGEDHVDGAEEAAAAAAKAGINVYVIGVGTTAGAEIPTASGSLTDPDGQPVHTALNEKMCREVARAGHGVYLHLDATNSAQEELRTQLANLKQGSTTTSFTTRDEQFQAVGLIVLLLLIMDACIRETRYNFLRRFKL